MKMFDLLTRCKVHTMQSTYPDAILRFRRARKTVVSSHFLLNYQEERAHPEEFCLNSCFVFIFCDLNASMF